MTDQQRRDLRWGLLSELVVQAGDIKLGRTAIVKIAYFLQTFKNVPLGYSFGLYTYGPFARDVLYDLGLLESMGAVKSRLKTTPSGYGYEFSRGKKLAEVQDLVGNLFAAYQDAIRWGLEEFGHQSAGDLELLSTLVFADRDAARKGQPLGFDELCRLVKAIKPRFPDGYILEKIKVLAGKGFLKARESANAH
jgi:uncharacterized protein